MDILELVKTIKRDCYFYRENAVLERIQELIDYLILKQANLKTIMPVLNILLDAISKKDIIMIGDCIEYGIYPFFMQQDVDLTLFEKKLIAHYIQNETIYYSESFSDELTLYVKNENGEILRMNSLFSPLHEVQEWISGIDIKKTTTIVSIFGIGTGLFAQELLKRMPETGRMLIYEPNKMVIDYCLKSGDICGCDERERLVTERIKSLIDDERVSVIVDESDELTHNSKLAEYFESKDYIDMMGMIITKHNRYEELYPKGYINYLRALNDFRLKMAYNKNTLKLFKRCYLENYLNNIWYFKNVYSGVDINKILPIDIPVVIVSAGPSLDKNIELLKIVKNHCLIFAVDSAVRFLVKRDIEPDITISLDPNKSFAFFSDDKARSVPCLFDIDANPQIVSKYNGKMLLFNCINGYAESLIELLGKEWYHLLDHGGSVATAAFKILRNNGQKKIILIGQDLAYENGISHAGGHDDNAGYARFEVEGINKEKVITRSDWLGYLKWFEKEIEDIKNKRENIEVIDATEGGALIHGSQVMSFQEAIDGCRDEKGNLPDYHFDKELEKLNVFLNVEEQNLLIKKHQEALDKLKLIRIKSEDAIRICGKLLVGIQNGTVSEIYLDKEKKKIYNINEFVRKCLIFPIINEYLITDVIEDVGYLMLEESDPKTMELNKIKMLKLSFEAILDAAINIQNKAKEIGNGRRGFRVDRI